MNLKKWFVFLLIFLMLLPGLVQPAFAAENPQFRYEMTVDGKDTVEVKTGDIITVTLHLYRVDENAPYTMHAMQSELRYDSSFFELVDDSAVLSNSIQSTDISVLGGMREFYMNFVSFSGGTQWQPKTRIGSFQLKVTGESGVTTITNEDFLVSLPDGSDSYKCESNALTVILSTDCTVKFETNGGTPIDPVTAIYGELLERPEDPTREGKRLAGWFKDIHLSEEWNFVTDTVKGNMTLYAKWENIPDETVAPTEPGDMPYEHGNRCMICGREDMLISGIPLCWICLIILILILLGILLIILLWKRRFIKYSLVNGDILLNFKNGKHEVQVKVVLFANGQQYSLNQSGTIRAKERLCFIKNVLNLPVADIKPGKYKGKLIITRGRVSEVRKCRIKVTEKELKEKK